MKNIFNVINLTIIISFSLNHFSYGLENNKDNQKKFVEDFGNASSEELLNSLYAKQKNAKPIYEGYDKTFHEFSKNLSLYAREKAKTTKGPIKANWHFLAAEAQFAHSKTGKEDYLDFLNFTDLSKNSDRVKQSQERIKSIEQLDRGLYDHPLTPTHTH